MDLGTHVEGLTRALAAAGTASGEEAQAFLERFSAPLESAIRLAMLNVLSEAAEEITEDLLPGSVDVRLRGGEPGFVVTPPMPGELPQTAIDDSETSPAAAATDEGPASRISLRLPERLKVRVEELAGRTGLSANAWLVRVVTSAVELEDRRRGSRRRGLQLDQGHSGWSK
jgi:hypothetical protein